MTEKRKWTALLSSLKAFKAGGCGHQSRSESQIVRNTSVVIEYMLGWYFELDWGAWNIRVFYVAVQRIHVLYGRPGAWNLRVFYVAVQGMHVLHGRSC